MPARRSIASTGLIAPDLDLASLVEETNNFHWASRISYQDVIKDGLDAFETLIYKWVVKAGRPLVVDGFDAVLEPQMFTPKWLRDNHGNKSASLLTISLAHLSNSLPS
jgi:hypothetical protein